MTSITEAQQIAAEYASTHEGFEPYGAMFTYGLNWVIGRVEDKHILIYPTGDIIEISVGLLSDLDDQATKPHKPVTAVPDGYEPPF